MTLVAISMRFGSMSQIAVTRQPGICTRLPTWLVPCKATPTKPMRTIGIGATANGHLSYPAVVAAFTSRAEAATAPATAAAPLTFRNSRRSIVIDALSGLFAEPAGFHVLRKQRTRTVLFAHALMKILEDAEPRVEAHEVDELKRSHRVIEPELERLVDVARGGHAFHQHE